MSDVKNNNPPSHRLSTVAASYVILRRDNKVLLLKRFNTGYKDGSYSLPSGHFEGAESAAAVAIREAREEVGIVIDPKDLTFAHIVHRVAEEGTYERVDFFFETDVWKGKVKNMEPHKCDELKWCAVNKLPENMTPEARQALEHFARGSYYSDLGF
jgi:8-oxo-dGTP pyrophosphatase MutT (NUDIX family)